MADVPVKEAAATTAKWVDKVGFSRLHQQGFKAAGEHGLGEMIKAVTFAEGKTWKGFARVGAVGAGAVIAAGALRSKDADGNERSGLVRVGQAVLGTGIAAAGVLGGRA